GGRMRLRSLTFVAAMLTFITAQLSAQAVVPDVPDIKTGGSANIKVLGRVPQGGFGFASDIEMEQELTRPYVYTPGFTGYFFQIVSVKDPANPQVIYRWTIENAELHRGYGAMDGKYFKIKGRYYYVQSLQL